MREHHLVHLKLSLTLLVGVLWMANLVIDETLMADISGVPSADLDFWGTNGAGFALIAAVGVFVSLIPSGLWSDMASKPESTEGVGRVSVLKRQEGAPLNLG